MKAITPGGRLAKDGRVAKDAEVRSQARYAARRGPVLARVRLIRCNLADLVGLDVRVWVSRLIDVSFGVQIVKIDGVEYNRSRMPAIKKMMGQANSLTFWTPYVLPGVVVPLSRLYTGVVRVPVHAGIQSSQRASRSVTS